MIKNNFIWSTIPNTLLIMQWGWEGREIFIASKSTGKFIHKYNAM